MSGAWPSSTRGRGRGRGRGTVADYKARRRRTAMSIPAATVRKAIESIRESARAAVEAKGEDIKRD